MVATENIFFFQNIKLKWCCQGIKGEKKRHQQYQLQRNLTASCFTIEFNFTRQYSPFFSVANSGSLQTYATIKLKAFSFGRKQVEAARLRQIGFLYNLVTFSIPVFDGKTKGFSFVATESLKKSSSHSSFKVFSWIGESGSTNLGDWRKLSTKLRISR